MKFSTAILSLLSLTAVSLAAPHGDHSRGKGGDRNSTTTNPGVPKVSQPAGSKANKTLNGLDESPGSGGSYNVIVDEKDPRTLDDLIKEMGLTRADLRYVYDNSAFKGFSANLSSHCVGKLSIMTGFKMFEPEMDVQLHDTLPGTWGLKRLSQTTTVSTVGQDISGFGFKNYAFNGTAGSLGKGVDIYVVDTGVNVNHIDFDGRAKFGFTFDGNKTDTEGHGTHCAGTAGSTSFGLAKAANIIAVKVLSGASGSSSDILMGIDWVISNHDKRKTAADFRGSVASMSLGSPTRSVAMEEAVKSASAAGIHFSVAAGNENQNSCNASPAAASLGTDVLSVGAVNVRDQRSSFSNFGQCVSVYAPGEQVTSTWVGGSNDVINTISGTSMACPHVTGLIAYYLGLDPSLKTDTAAMKAKIISTARKITLDKDATTGDPGILINNGITKQ
ncbi:subtilisin-like protein [Choiromyces venosus 120613-1]|uniref:Subtilisin-like protein n=1 Tax=Choiromyces venosus 120613-1 TaxID=1336337 RepID=A0A3N4JVT6_9PEZI|nr:subtilisin-like protein [Choiromyces venosus 120613-1]